MAFNFKSINKVIRVLIMSDLILSSGWGLLAPVFAIFILNNIDGGSVQVAGFSAAIYWGVKSFLQIPFSGYLDKTDGEKDDFYFLFFGLLITAAVPVGYLFASIPSHIYLLQIIYAIGMAMAVPAWLAIFTRHIDHGKEALEWGFESTGIGIGSGVAGAVGGLIVTFFGFKTMLILVSSLTFISTFLLLAMTSEITSRPKTKNKIIIQTAKT